MGKGFKNLLHITIMWFWRRGGDQLDQSGENWRGIT